MAMFGRPQKVRLVSNEPKVVQFSPRGKPGRPDEIELGIDFLEALKLADFEGLDQTQAAQRMGISRATLGRILREARRRIADAVVNGKIIRIAGGNIRTKINKKGRK